MDASSVDVEPARGTRAESGKQEKNMLTEASLAQRQLCSGLMLKEVVAACARFVPADFPTDYTVGSQELKPLLECYFYSCQHDAALKGQRGSIAKLSQDEITEAVRLGVSHAGRKSEQMAHLKSCLLPKSRAEEKAAPPPQSIAMLASKYEDLASSEKCPK